MIKDLVMCMWPRTPAIWSEWRKYPTVVSDWWDPLDPWKDSWYSRTDINNIKVEDWEYARVSSPLYAGISQNLFSSWYWFNVPLNAIINWVTVTIKKRWAWLTKTYDVNVSLVIWWSIVWENKANLIEWAITNEDTIYWWNTDLRGNTLTPQIINSSDFWLAIACTVK